MLRDEGGSLKALLDAGLLIAKVHEELGQPDLAIKSFKYYQASPTDKGFKCLQNHNLSSKRIMDAYFEDPDVFKATNNFVKTQKSYMDKRLAFITEKVEANWDKFDKSRVGMLSSG